MSITIDEASPEWSDEIHCPWCLVQNYEQIETEPNLYKCDNCGRLFEIEVKTGYVIHKIGRIENHDSQIPLTHGL